MKVENNTIIFTPEEQEELANFVSPALEDYPPELHDTLVAFASRPGGELDITDERNDIEQDYKFMKKVTYEILLSRFPTSFKIKLLSSIYKIQKEERDRKNKERYEREEEKNESGKI